MLASLHTPGPDDRFQSTRWSVVVAAGQGATESSEAALATLCKTYWYPLYAWLRRRGRSPDDAKDLTQEFFVRLLEQDFAAKADEQKGKFRTFLLTVFQRFVTKQDMRNQAVKRGGGVRHLSINYADGEERYAAEGVDSVSPDVVFDRQWALTLLSNVLNRLRLEYEQKQKARLFDALQTCFTPDSVRVDYSQVSADLQMTEGAVRVAAHRLRERYRCILRDEIAGTLDADASIEDELQHLRAALKR